MSDHDQQHQEQGYRTASYQGEHLRLRLNRRAIADLCDVLDGLLPGSSRRSSGRMRVRLPDGRDLTLTVAVTDDGAVRDEHGEWIGDDGLAHGDVTGDLGRHHDAAQVIEAVTRTGYLDPPLPGEEPQEVDAGWAGWLERRDRDVIDGALGRLAARHAYGSASDRQWVRQLRDRAGRAAAATRPGRLAEAQRMAEQMKAARRRRQTDAQPRPGSQPAI